MKRKISFGIAVLMILATCLLVSCNSEVSTAQVNDGKLVYATFDKSSKAIRPSSSSMTISYELDNIDDLYWVYTATKTDGAGTTGQTAGERVPGNAQYKGLGGAIGPFSKGTWTFTVEGYKYTGASTDVMNPTVEQLRTGTDFNLIYVGTADGVVLNVTNTSGNPEPINITVYLQTQGGTGTLKIAKNSKFFWAETGEGGFALEDLKLKVYDGETLKDTINLTGHASDPNVPGDAVYYSNSEDASIDGLASGDHVFKVQIVRNVGGADQVFFEGTANAKIYAGITTVLDTQAIEGLFTYAQFNGTIDDSAVVVVATKSVTTTSAGSVSFETDYTPASGINPSAEKTTVSITGDDSVISAATYDLGVETSNIIAAGAKFSVASDSTAVASVDLTLTKTEGSTTTTVSDFGTNGAATVTTYIAKNLTNVKFFYEDTAFTKVNSTEALGVDKFYYEKTTGRLVFKTRHFSEFYVTSTDEAFNATQGKAFETFGLSITSGNYERGDVVVLLKNISVSESTNAAGDIHKGLTIDGNGKTITCVGTGGTGGYVLSICDPGDSEPERYEIKNLTINSTKSQAAILFNSSDARYLFEESSTNPGYYFPSDDAENNRNEAILSNITINSEGECIYSNGLTTVTAYNCTLNRNGQYNSGRKSIYLSAAMIGYSGVLNLYDCVVTSDCNGIASFETGSILNVYGDTVITSTFDSLDTDTKQQYSDTSFASGKAVYCINGDYDPYKDGNTYYQYASYSSINIQSGTINGEVLLAQSNIRSNIVGPSFRATLTLATGVIVKDNTVPSTLSMTTSTTGKWKPNESYTDFVSAN